MKKITSRLLARWPLPKLDHERGKASRGTLLVVGGSETVQGAPLLAALAGLRVGAGTIQVATTTQAQRTIAAAMPEAAVIALPTARGEIASSARNKIRQLARDATAVVLGSGSTTSSIVEAVGGSSTWVLDAGVIPACTAARTGRASTVITPHPGEMAKLHDVTPAQVLAQPRDYAVRTARELGCVVVMKGSVSFVAGDAAVYESTAGNHGLGSSGSGDVLAGIIGGLLSRGADALQAAVWGVHLHGAAGDVLARRIGPYGYRAMELVDVLPGLAPMRRQK